MGFEKIQSKFITSNQQEGNTQQDSTSKRDNSASGNTTEGTPNDKSSVGHIVIQCTQGLGESMKKICRKYGIQTHFKGNRTSKQLLVKPKNQDPIDKKSGVIYLYMCVEHACNEKYIGETSRAWGKGSRSIWRNPLLSMHTVPRLDTIPHLIASAS